MWLAQYQVMFFCEPHTAAEPTEEIPYVDKASGVRGSSRPGNHRQDVVPETSNEYYMPSRKEAKR